jgi:hypothetical protein
MKRNYPLTELWQERDTLVERRESMAALMELMFADIKLIDRRLDDLCNEIERQRRGAA